MNEAHDDLQAELHRLADRLTRIEEHLNLPVKPVSETPKAKPPPPIIASPVAPPTTIGSAAPFRPVAAQTMATLLDRKKESQGDRAPLVPPTPQIHPRPLKKKPKSGASLEVLIGGKWLAWLGAIVIVIAVGWLLQYGYSQGWFGRITPGWRCLFIAAFGFFLILCGEIALRKVGHAAAVGLFGAGIATIYMTTLAASWIANPPLISDLTVFILLGMAALLGVAITLRGRLLSIGVLSILGGYLAPILASAESSIVLAFPLYLTMLFGVTLALSSIVPKPFRALRYVGMAGQAALSILWLFELDQTNGILAIIFFGLWWAMLLFECIRAAIREESPRGNAAATLLATFWFTAVGCVALRGLTTIGDDWLGAFTLGVGGLAVAAAGQFGPGLEALKRAPRNAIERLALSLWAQGAVLLTVAIALQFDGYGRTVAWLMVGLAAIETGRRLPSRRVDVFGVVVLVFALLQVISADFFNPTLKRIVIPITDSCNITGWSILALLATAVLAACAHRVRPDKDGFWRFLSFAFMVTAILGWCSAWVNMGEGLTITAGWLLAAVPFLALAPYGRALRYREFALGVVLLTACRWFAVDGITTRMEDANRVGTLLPLLNAQTLVGVLIGIVGYWASRPGPPVSQEEPTDEIDSAGRAGVGGSSWRSFQQIALLFVAFFVLIVMSFEIDRAVVRALVRGPIAWPDWQLRFLWWTALWAGGAITLLVLGHRRKWKLLVGAGWVTLLACGGCWLFVGTLLPRFTNQMQSDHLLLNVQFMIGAALAGGIAFAIFTERKNGAIDRHPDRPMDPCVIGWALVGLIGLWLGSLEIDRYFNTHMTNTANAKMASQAGLSIYWMLYGIGLVTVGFAKRVEWSRYCGLGLIGVVLAKVVFIDTVELSGLYRPLSAIVVGLLTMGISIAYLKISPRILGENIEDEDEPEQPPVLDDVPEE